VFYVPRRRGSETRVGLSCGRKPQCVLQGIQASCVSERKPVEARPLSFYLAETMQTLPSSHTPLSRAEPPSAGRSNLVEWACISSWMYLVLGGRLARDANARISAGPIAHIFPFQIYGLPQGLLPFVDLCTANPKMAKFSTVLSSILSVSVPGTEGLLLRIIVSSQCQFEGIVAEKNSRVITEAPLHGRGHLLHGAPTDHCS
jgi:hypothetical protein